MKIIPAKSSDYASVNAESVVFYINTYADKVSEMVFNEDHKPLSECNKTQLNAIAAELETVCKRLDWILNGQY